MCLYNWIARCERTKLAKPKKGKSTSKGNNDDDAGVTEGELSIDEFPNFTSSRSGTTSNVFRLLSEHPLADSHGIRCLPVESEKVPNFVGPTLPRCDQGDREYYCCVMLTLFEPW